MMLSSSLSFLFVVLFSICVGHGYAKSSNKIQCQSSVLKEDKCKLNVVIPRGCKSSTLILDQNQIPKLCSTVRLFWSYPMNDLIVILQPSYYQEKQPFAIHLHNPEFNKGIEYIYQRINNRDIQITTTTDKKIIVKSDSKYEVVLKFQGSSQSNRHGVNLIFDIVKIK